MTSEQLHSMCDIAASIGKDMGLDRNFGMGAKVASLPSNKYGLRYRSNRGGVVSEVLLGQRDGVYGRIRRLNEQGELEEVFDVTEAALADGDDLSSDWTEVVLFGNRPDQNTVRDPYDGNPAQNGQWLADYLYHRFYRLPPGIQVKFQPGTHKLDGNRLFRTIPDRAYPIGQSESVLCENGIIVHYFLDPPRENSGHNRSVTGAITTDVSTCAVVHRDELYSLKRGRQWTLDAPLYGIPFGAKHISVHVELPDGALVLPEAYRQFLRYRDGDQRQVDVRDFADLVRDHRPQWLLDAINSFAPSDSGGTDEIRDELQKLLNSLRVRSESPSLAQNGDLAVDRGQGTAMAPERSDGSGGEKETSETRFDFNDLLAVPSGAKRASMSLNAERAPEITLLRDEADIQEKGLKGRAAKFYREAGQLFVNMNYPAIHAMQEQLELEYASHPDPEITRNLAKELAERTIVGRVGRAVVYALAKQLNREWQPEDVAKAHTSESLSLAADDYLDALQNARRRMGMALRTVKQDVLVDEDV
ncbi:ATP-binding protein [Devosia ginsengisoli]|uniref:ATP-binding protein n=1 Tax=Devosia ginsengisoli TaxID=400770 RepID=A0A5B8LXT5_9HYPH|nr:ATP-binding protein [Devosia ginsengisoli]QDZ13127.1 ATP-binding protein [Devosia ginsengisoli]